MNPAKIESIDLLDKIIIGRVEPHIYAFKTNTIPNYLKISQAEAQYEKNNETGK